MHRPSTGGWGTAAPAAAAAVVPAAEGHKGRGGKGGMAPLTTLWSDLVRRKSAKGKLVRYDHPPDPTEVEQQREEHSPPNWFKLATSFQSIPSGTSRKIIKSMLIDAGSAVGQLAGRVSSLEQQLDYLQVDRDASNASMSNLHKQLSDSRAALYAAQKQVRDLQEYLREVEEAAAVQHESLLMLKAEYTAMCADNYKAQDKIVELIAQAEDAAETKVAALRLLKEELSAARADRAEVQQQAAALNQQLQAAQAEACASAQQVQELQQQLDETRTAAKQQQLLYEQLHGELFAVEGKAQQHEQQAYALMESLTDTQQELQQAKQQVEQLTEQLAQLSHQLKQQQEATASAQGAAAVLQFQLQESTCMASSMVDDLETSKSNIRQLQESKQDAENTAEGLRHELQAAQQQRLQHQRELQTAQQHLLQQQHEMQMLQLQCDELRVASSAALSSAAVLQQQLSSKDTELAQQQEAAAALARQVEQQSTVYKSIINGSLDDVIDSMYSNALAAAELSVCLQASPQAWQPLRTKAQAGPSGDAAATTPADADVLPAETAGVVPADAQPAAAVGPVHAVVDTPADAAACEAVAAAGASEEAQAAEQQGIPHPAAEPCITPAALLQDGSHASTNLRDRPQAVSQPQGGSLLISSSASTAGNRVKSDPAAIGSITPRKEIQIPSALRLDLPNSPAGQTPTDKAARQPTSSAQQQDATLIAVLGSPTPCTSPPQQKTAGRIKAAKGGAAAAANSSSSSAASISPTAIAAEPAPHVPVFRRLMNTAFGRSLTSSTTHSPFSLAALRSSSKSPQPQGGQALPSPQGWDSPVALTAVNPQGSMLAAPSTAGQAAAFKSANLRSNSPASKPEEGDTVTAGGDSGGLQVPSLRTSTNSIGPGSVASTLTSDVSSAVSFGSVLRSSNSSFSRPVCRITGGSTSCGGGAAAAGPRSRIPSLGGAAQPPTSNNSTHALQQGITLSTGGAGSAVPMIKSRIPSAAGAPDVPAAGSAANSPKVVSTKLAAVTGSSLQARSRTAGGASALPSRIPTPNHSSCGAAGAAVRKGRSTSCTIGSTIGSSSGGWSGSSDGGSSGGSNGGSNGGSPHLAGKSRIPVFSDTGKGGKISLALTGTPGHIRTLGSSSSGGSSSGSMTPTVQRLLSKTTSRIPSLLGVSAGNAAAALAPTPAADETARVPESTSPTAVEAGAAFKRAVQLQQAGAASAGAAAAAASGHVTAITATAAFGTVRTLQKVNLKAGSGSTDGFCITLAAPSAVARGTAAAMAAAVGIHPDMTVTLQDSTGSWSPKGSSTRASGACSPTGRRRMMMEGPLPHGMGSYNSS